MSEAIKIQEGGVDRTQNQINKLKTNLSGGGVCYWVPETERQTDGKRITENGTYTAEEEGLYGYDEINVSVPNTGKMSGTGADGNEYVVDVDDNGYIVETKVPSQLVIVTPPTKTQYNDGETIDLSGIVVHACDAEGNVMQTLGASDLTFSPTIADISQAHDSKYISDLVPEGVKTGVPPFIKYSNEAHTAWREVDGGDVSVVWEEGSHTHWGVASSQDFVCTIWDKWKSDDGRHNVHNYDASSYRHSGKTVYYRSWYGVHFRYGQNAPMNYINESSENILWTAVYGELQVGGQTVTVTWTRPDDFVPLSATFEIEVAE